MRRFFIDSGGKLLIIMAMPQKEPKEYAFGVTMEDAPGALPWPSSKIPVADFTDEQEYILVEKVPFLHVIDILDMIVGGDVARAALPQSYFYELESAHVILQEAADIADDDGGYPPRAARLTETEPEQPDTSRTVNGPEALFEIDRLANVLDELNGISIDHIHGAIPAQRLANARKQLAAMLEQATPNEPF